MRILWKITKYIFSIVGFTVGLLIILVVGTNFFDKKGEYKITQIINSNINKFTDTSYSNSDEGSGDISNEDIPSGKAPEISQETKPITPKEAKSIIPKEIKPVVGVDSFVAFKTNNEINCLTLCGKTMKNHGVTAVGSSAHVYKLMHEVGKGISRQLVNYGSDVANNYENAINCINRHLDNNRPIIVGVNHTTGRHPLINEGATDHFILIVGRGYDKSRKRNYYTYYDMATSYRQIGTNIEKNILLYDPYNYSLKDVTPIVRGDDGEYSVTQVRPNDGITSGTVNQNLE